MSNDDGTNALLPAVTSTYGHSSAPASIKLPYDILHALPGFVNFETLKSLSLISKDMNHDCNRYLWKSFAITIPATAHKKVGESGEPDLPDSLLFIADARRAVYVEHLSIHHRVRGHRVEDYDAIETGWTDVVRLPLIMSLNRHLTTLRHVKSLSITTDGWESALAESMYHRQAGLSSFWELFPLVQSLEMRSSQAGQRTWESYFPILPHFEEDRLYDILPHLTYLSTTEIDNTDVTNFLFPRPLIGFSLDLTFEKLNDYRDACRNCMDSSGPLQAIKISNSEVSPSTMLFTEILQHQKDLTELEISQFSLSSDVDRTLALRVLGDLPSLRVLSWTSTWEESWLLWKEFCRRMVEQPQSFPRLTYVAFGAPSSYNPAHIRHTRDTETGSFPFGDWEESLSCPWEVSVHLPRLHRLRTEIVSLEYHA